MTATRNRSATADGALPTAQTAGVAGLLLLAAGSAVVLGIMTAEALYPVDYNVHRNTVSDLAAMRPEDIVRQPSAAIFNITMIVAGALIVVAAVLLYRSRARLLAILPVAGLGLGMIGVGVFPGNPSWLSTNWCRSRHSCAGCRGDSDCATVVTTCCAPRTWSLGESPSPS